MIWKKEIECMQPAELKKLQSDYLKKLIPYIYNNCPVYKKKIDDAGVKPDQIKSIDDIKRLPFTTKIDMRDNYPYGLFSAKDKDVVEIHISSGTTGNPTSRRLYEIRRLAVVGRYGKNNMLRGR